MGHAHSYYSYELYKLRKNKYVARVYNSLQPQQTYSYSYPIIFCHLMFYVHKEKYVINKQTCYGMIGYTVHSTDIPFNQYYCQIVYAMWFDWSYQNFLRHKRLSAGGLYTLIRIWCEVLIKQSLVKCKGNSKLFILMCFQDWRESKPSI